jgi:hypothetical protein
MQPIIEFIPNIDVDERFSQAVSRDWNVDGAGLGTKRLDFDLPGPYSMVIAPIEDQVQQRWGRGHFDGDQRHQLIHKVSSAE